MAWRFTSSRGKLAKSRTLVQDAEQIVEIIAVILFLSRGRSCTHLGIHTSVERLGEDGVGHNRADIRRSGLGLFGGLSTLHRLGSGSTLGIHMGLNGFINFRGALETGSNHGDAHLIAQALIKRSTPNDV